MLRHKYGRVRLEHVIAEAVEALLDRRDRDRRCAFVEADGSRCGSRDFLEYDHVDPFAWGGPSNEPANIRLYCRPHNQARVRGLAN